MTKSVLITGCSPGGIGHSLAKEFKAGGLRVFATARKTETISDLADLGIETLSVEVHKADSIERLRDDVQRLTGGRLDYLVNNAGKNLTVPALEMDIDEVREMFEVNVFAVMRMCQVFAPMLMEAKGTIVQIGSIAGVMPFVFGSSYNASKAALHEFSDTLRVELAPFGVRVVVVATGGVKSNIARNDRSLKDDSFYMSISEEYERRVKFSQHGAMPNEVYAQSVVRQILVKNPARYIWEGKSAWTIWFVRRFLPGFTLDGIFYRMFKLWKLEPRYASKGK